jgi:WD40 repeat protein
MARPSRRPGSTTRSGSERRPPGRRSRASRGIPSWSWPWPSLPTADSSPRQAWTTAKVWDIPGGGPARTLTGQAAAVAALAVKPDGKEAAVAAGRSVRIWDLAKSASIEELEGFASEVSSVAWRQDGAQIAAGDRSHTIRLWKGDFTPDGLIETPADAVLGLAYVPGKPMLVSAGSDGIARLWQLPVAKPRRIDSKGAARVFVVCHEGNRAASAGATRSCESGHSRRASS